MRCIEYVLGRGIGISKSMIDSFVIKEISLRIKISMKFMYENVRYRLRKGFYVPRELAPTNVIV